MTKNNIAVRVITGKTNNNVFLFKQEHGAAALAAVRAHQEIHAMGSINGAAGLSDLVIPYSAVHYVGWTIFQSDETVEDANCKVQTPEPEVASMIIKSNESGSVVDMSFTLTLGDTSINGTYGDFTFTNGVAQATIHAQGQLKLTGIADGTSYTISGNNIEAVSGSLTGTTPATVAIQSTSE